MTKPWSIGPSTKLPRGQYLYITVGHRYYAGEAVIIEEVKESIRAPVDRERYMRRGWWRGGSLGLGRDYWRLQKRQRDRRKVPEYMKQYEDRHWRQPPDTKVTRNVSGESEARLTDDLKEAKRFRTWGQAERACERIRAMYAGFDVKVTIKEGKDEHCTGTDHKNA